MTKFDSGPLTLFDFFEMFAHPTQTDGCKILRCVCDFNFHGKLQLNLHFFRNNWKIAVALLLFNFACGFIGYFAGIHKVTAICALIVDGIFFIWLGLYASDLWRVAAFLNAGKQEEAIVLCEKIIAKHPSETTAYVNASAAYLGLSKPVEAFRYADKAVELDSSLNLALNNRSMANLQMNRVTESLDDIERAIELAPQSNKARLSHFLAGRANVHARIGDVDAALKDCDESLRLVPGNLFALLTRAHCYCVARRYEDAIADLERACPPSSPPIIRGYALTGRARVFLSQGNVELALADANDSITCCPDAAPLLAIRGIILTRAKQFDAARVDLDKAIALDEYLAEAYWFRAELFQVMGKSLEAESDRQIATKYQYHPYL